jgi:GTPase SAR1 family protein
MAPLYYRNANAAVLAFDITNKDSFSKVRYWIKELIANGPQDCMVVICGNKSDREIERNVSTEEAQSLAQEVGYPYFETSAKFDQGINSMFDFVANNLPPEAATPEPRLSSQHLEMAPVEDGSRKKGCEC